MDKGYYKPEINEFCAGFEYEYLSFSSRLMSLENNALEQIGEKVDSWKNQVYTAKKEHGFFNAFDFDTYLENGNIRVKLLDREDIEEEGFSHDQTTKDGAYFYKGSMLDKHEWCLTAENAMGRKGGDYTRISIYDINKKSDFTFYGYIRNRTEFKKLLKQLGI